MRYRTTLSKILNAGATLAISGILLGSIFITSSWGMDPPPTQDEQPPRSRKFWDFSLASKPKSKQQPDAKLKPNSMSKSKPKRQSDSKPRSDSMSKPKQPDSETSSPSRQRAYSLVPAGPMPKPALRPRSNSAVPSDSKPSIIPSKSKQKSQLHPIPKPAYEKLISSERDLEKALNPATDYALSPFDNYGSLKIVTSPNEQLNQKEIPFQKLFQHYPKITMLSISGLTLGGTETGDLRMKELAIAVSFIPLEKLSLSNCGINELGMKRLASILVRSAFSDTLGLADTLKELDLSYNKIGDTGAKAIETSLKKNSTLTNLNLNRNQIGDIGTTNLARLLGANSTLKAIYLTDNEITGRGILDLLKALDSRSNLALYLGNNTFEVEDNYEFLFLNDSLPESVCLIKNNQLGLIFEEDQLYCKVHNQEKMKISDSLYTTEGLPLETLNNIISIIRQYLINGDYSKAMGKLVPFKKPILRYTSRIGYTPLVNDLHQYDVLMQPLAVKNIQVYLPEKPGPYIVRHRDD